MLRAESLALDAVPQAARGGLIARLRGFFGPYDPDTEFMRETSAAVMQGPRPLSHWILWSTLAFVAIALVWAALAKVDEITVGEGKVIPSSQVQVVQNLEGGIVSEILVKAGDTVQKDQIVMRLDETRFASSFREGQAKDHALIGKIARLTAEANNTPFVAPAELAKDNAKVLTEEKALYESRQHDLRANLAVLAQQVEQRRHELAEKQSRAGQLQDSYALIAKELAMTRPLAAKGVVSEVEILRLERQATDTKGDLDATRLMIPRLEAAAREVRQKMEEITAQFRADAMKDLNQARAEQSALSAANTGLEDRVTRTVVRAPKAGIVKQLKVFTVGGVIQPGMDLMEIVPAEDTLLIEAKVRPADIAFLKPGQEATVKLSAYDFSIYGGMAATLEHISADTLVPDKPNERPEPGWDKPVSVIPGMIATVDIKTNQRTILQYLLKPIIKTKEAALRER